MGEGCIGVGMSGLLCAYYVSFVLAIWPVFMRHGWQRARVYSIADEVAHTDATPREGLRLMQIAARESGFDRSAIGHKGERGCWQVMPPARSYGASEALWRMRYQGMVAFVGCRHADDKVVLPNGVHTTCQEMIDHRIAAADAYLAAHPAPSDSNIVRNESENP